MPLDRCEVGDCREIMRRWVAEGVRVQMCVTSPPYWGLRDYGVEGQIGLEPTPEAYVANMVEVFVLVRELLADDGVLWLNLGDCYATGAGKVGECPGGGDQGERWKGNRGTHTAENSGKHASSLAAMGPRTQPNRMPIAGLKPKDLVGIPWRVAFALQAAGWYLRSDIIWSKPNPMPESVNDRPTKAHEYLFLLSRSGRYYYDAEAIKEPCESGPSDIRKMEESLERIGGKHKTLDDPYSKASGATNIGRKRSVGSPSGRNRRTVWEIATQPYSGAHFATFPEALVEPCILAGSSLWACAGCGRSIPRSDYEEEVPRMRKGVREEGEANGEVLLQALLEQNHSSQSPLFEGLCDGPEGVQADSRAESSDGEQRGLRHGAPACDGGNPGAHAEARRGGASQEWGQGRQPSGEPRTDGERRARQAAEATYQADCVPALRGRGNRVWTCSACGCGEKRQSVILDPFMGSGTVGQVAQRLGRRWLGCELNPEYLKLQAVRTAQTGMELA